MEFSRYFPLFQKGRKRNEMDLKEKIFFCLVDNILPYLDRIEKEFIEKFYILL